MPLQREHHLDSIRAMLMLMGIPFHASLMYSYHKWAVNSTPPSLWLSLLNDCMHSFRMPVFFVISGYFSCMLLTRRTPQEWLRSRLKRLLLPFVAALVVIGLPQFWLIVRHTPAALDWQQASPGQRADIGIWLLVSHLWFLATLAMLSVCCRSLLVRLAHGTPDWLSGALPPQRIRVAALLCGALFVAACQIASTIWPNISRTGLYNFLVTNSLLYLPFFLLGALAWSSPPHRRWLHTVSAADVVHGLLAIALYVINENTDFAGDASPLMQFFLTFPAGLFMTKVLFTLGQQFANQPSQVIQYLIGASLFIYLVHHPLTILFGVLTAPLHLPAWAGFGLANLSVLTLSLGLYEAHRRLPLLVYLLSGKRPSDAAA